MKNLFLNNSKRTIAILLLGFFIFSFLHSELGLLDFDGDNHGSHDYCQLVKSATTHSKILHEEILKLEPNKDICFHCSEEMKVQAALIIFEKRNYHIKAKSTDQLYLATNTILI